MSIWLLLLIIILSLLVGALIGATILIMKIIKEIRW